MLHVVTLHIIIKGIKDYESLPINRSVLGKNKEQWKGKMEKKKLNMQNTVDIMIKVKYRR